MVKFRSQESLPATFGLLHNSFQFQSPADGDFMKKKLPHNPFPKHETPNSLLGSSAIDPYHRRLPLLNIPMSMSPRGPDTAGRLPEGQMFSASPRSGPFSRLAAPGHRSPLDMSDVDRSPPGRSTRNNSDDASMRSSYDYSGADDMELDEGPSPKRLHADDAYASGGQKRRAASPARDDAGLYFGAHREPGCRGSPTPRLVTSTSALAKPQVSRADSYTSTATMTTAQGSFGRRSPSGYSTGCVSPISATSPYPTPLSSDPSPRASLSAKSQASHGCIIPGSSATRKASETKMPVQSSIKSNYRICECCPKKPRKFESKAELE